MSSAGPALAIVADDLTGALDAAAPFADRGLAVRVATSPRALPSALAGADVVAVSTRSREVSAGVARAAVEGVLALLPPGVRVFKKVDSRLKGNVAAEVAAFGDVPVLAVPALPEFGRVVRDGRVVGHGVGDPIPVAAAIGRDALVPDVETAEDMAVALAASPDRLVVGARGAAVAMAAAMGDGRGPLPALRAPATFVVGSTDPITLAQVDRLVASHPGVRVIPAPDGHAPPAPPHPGVTLLQAVPGSGATAGSVAAALAASATAVARDAASLVVTGGATAEAVLDAFGIEVLDLRGDVLPGLPLSRAGGRVIVTKSGGFGEPDTLSRLAREASA